MSTDIPKAREHVERARALLVNRVGFESDVREELEDALSCLDVPPEIPKAAAARRSRRRGRT